MGRSLGRFLVVVVALTTIACGDDDVPMTADSGMDGAVDGGGTGVPGIAVTPTSGLSTSEAGTSADFTVTLLAEPSADVVVPVASSDETEGTVSPASLTFTMANWNAPQTVTVTGVDDDEADGNVSYMAAVGPATSSDSGYDGLDADDVSLTNLDDETAGIIVAPTSGLSTSEAGGDDTFNVVLQTQPTADVTVALSSSDEGEGTVAPSSVTFTAENWNAPQTVTVTGVDDDVADGPQVYMIVTAPATSDDTSYVDLDADDVSVTNVDDETAGITVDPTSGLTTTEGGGDDTFTVVLNSMPTGNVVIPVSSSDEGEGTVAPLSLTFTGDNWNAPQTVTVTGVDDDIADGNQSLMAVVGVATSTDADYEGIDADDVGVTNVDDETAGITVTEISGTTGEDGTAATFTVVLNSEPTADVVIGLSSADEGEGLVAPVSVTFTSDNWNAPQTLTVTGQNDDLADGNQPYLIVTGAAVSADTEYDGMDADDVAVINVDDDSPGITVDPTEGLRTTESGGTDSFDIWLNSQPTADVLIGISSTEPSEGTVSTDTVTFTPENWNGRQTITVTGIDDDVADGDQVFRIMTAVATSSDADYDGLDADNVDATNVDNDSPGITVTPVDGLETTEGGGMDSFEIELNSRPSADVRIGISSDTPAEGTVSTDEVVFTTDNWNAPQTVTVTGEDDDVADGNQPYRIVTAAATSGDLDYAGLDAENVEVTNIDDDSPGVRVRLADGVSDEDGDTATVRLVLTSEPTADVVIVPMSGDETEGVPDVADVTFTPMNWNAPQTFTLTGQDDDLADGNQYYDVSFTVTSADSGYDGIATAIVPVLNMDDDSPGVTINVIDSVSRENGETAELEIVLLSEPFSTVRVFLASTDESEGIPDEARVAFSPTNWNAPQYVTVSGRDDDVADGNQRYRIDWNIGSTDTGYRSLVGTTDEITNVDDDSPGVTVRVVDDESGEDLSTASVEVELDSEPTHPVTITFTSNDATEGSIVTAPVMIMPAAWDSVRTVTIRGVNDDVADGNQVYDLDWAATSTDTGYDGRSGTTTSITNIDNDSPGISFTIVDDESGELPGNTASFEIELDSEPTHDVTISFTSTDGSEAASPADVMFTSMSWSSARTITVAGVNDDVADGHQTYAIDYDVSSTDTGYNMRSGRIETFTNLDDDSPGVSTRVVDSTTGEDGSQGSITVVLLSEPTHPVTISLTSNRPDEGRPDDASIMFDDSDWNIEQTVTVTGWDDFVADGDQRFEIDWSASSTDTGYDGRSGNTDELTNVDDDSAGLIVDERDSITRENGNRSRTDITLRSQPFGDVDLTFTVSDDTEGVLLGASTITITPLDWAIPRVVRVVGEDDFVVDGDVDYTLTISTSSTDMAYDALSDVVVGLTNRDDDSPAVVVTPVDSVTDEGGETGSFTVVLGTIPADDVTLTVSSSNTDEGDIISATTLTFTPGTWGDAQTVTVEGQDDAVNDGDIAYTIMTSATMSMDPDYNNLSVDDVAFVNVDDDRPGLRLSTPDLETDELGDTARLRIRLRSEPTAPVTVTITSGDTTEGTITTPAAGFLTFDDTNWGDYQDVYVTGEPDGIPDGDTLYTVTISTSSMDSDYEGLSIDRFLINYDIGLMDL